MRLVPYYYVLSSFRPRDSPLVPLRISFPSLSSSPSDFFLSLSLPLFRSDSLRSSLFACPSVHLALTSTSAPPTCTPLFYHHHHHHSVSREPPVSVPARFSLPPRHCGSPRENLTPFSHERDSSRSFFRFSTNQLNAVAYSATSLILLPSFLCSSSLSLSLFFSLSFCFFPLPRHVVSLDLFLSLLLLQSTRPPCSVNAKSQRCVKLSSV